MLILDQIKPYLTPPEYLEAVYVVYSNEIETHSFKSVELAFSVLFAYDQKGNWTKRYENALRLQRIESAVNQINQQAQAVTCETFEAGQTKPL